MEEWLQHPNHSFHPHHHCYLPAVVHCYKRINKISWTQCLTHVLGGVCLTDRFMWPWNGSKWEHWQQTSSKITSLWWILMCCVWIMRSRLTFLWASFDSAAVSVRKMNNCVSVSNHCPLQHGVGISCIVLLLLVLQFKRKWISGHSDEKKSLMWLHTYATVFVVTKYSANHLF